MKSYQDRSYIILLLIITISFFYIFITNTHFTKVVKRNIPAFHSEIIKPLAGISVLLISDLHIENSTKSFQDWVYLINAINDSAADYVLFAGDYIGDIDNIDEINEIRFAFISSLERINRPFALVLGNHETWTGRQDWLNSLHGASLPVLENDTIVLQGDHPICVIGVGDSYSGFSAKVEISQACSVLPQIFLTHDPQAAFENTENGVWLAGHTHCGQIRLPFIGAPWVPSSAPKGAHCGLYQDGNKTIFTSSGVGTSMLPIRFFAQSQIELLTFE